MIEVSGVDIPKDRVAIIIVDHGSRRDESNQMLLEIVEAYRRQSHWSIVEPAHMELADPTIAMAFERCVEQGAELVVVFPYFLSPGRHWHEDIPRLAAEAAERWPNVKHLVTEPFGMHPLVLEIINDRIVDGLHRN